MFYLYYKVLLTYVNNYTRNIFEVIEKNFICQAHILRHGYKTNYEQST